MQFNVDPAFKQGTAQARQRRRARQLVLGLRLAGAAMVCAVVCGGVWWWTTRPEVSDLTQADALHMVGVDVVPEAAPTRPGAAVLVHLRRDPMILRIDAQADAAPTRLSGPSGVFAARAGPDRPDRLTVLREALVASEQKLVAHLPSTAEDFAFFRAQRRQALMDAHPVQLQTATASVALVQPVASRRALYEDTVIVLRRAQTLQEVLPTKGFSAAATERIVGAAERLIKVGGALPQGSLIALRHRPDDQGGEGPALLHMSIYEPDRYLASLARTGAGRFQVAADPWSDQDLLTRAHQAHPDPQAGTDEIRLLDALYSLALRQDMSADLVGEMIVMLSRKFDLNRKVDPSERVTILQATYPTTGGATGSELLFVGVEGGASAIRCYVVPDPKQPDTFQCFDGRSVTQAVTGGGLVADLRIPVSGVRTSGFGPRLHPILKEMRPHTGVDWAAPTGTPVYAAQSGVVRLAQVQGGYGNLMVLDHGAGLETRYAHLHAFAEALVPGTKVRKGQVIAYVGSTGRSTGPHLHFEVRRGGTPVNPVAQNSGAVEALVNKIIKVESAGRADAKNPLSTATGLGQFIEGTWLRMLRDHRPDLVEGRSRKAQLDLRFDPELSRDMVRNLARENEAHLRRKGHQITAGRLYLAHFLGAAGAHQALAADPDATVAQIMGAAVVSANPFLRSKTIADLKNWADRKMSGASQVVSQTVPSSVAQFQKHVDQILAGL